jgi:hypothetical protein
MRAEKIIQQIVSSSWSDMILRTLAMTSSVYRQQKSWVSVYESGYIEAFKLVYAHLSSEERFRPQTMTDERKEHLMHSLGISRRVFAHVISFLGQVREDFDCTLRDVIEYGKGAFTPIVVDVIRHSGSVSRGLGDRSLNSAHWLLALYDCGSPLIRQRLTSLGLNRLVIISSCDILRRRQVGAAGKLGSLCLSADGKRVFEQIVDSRSAAPGTRMSEGVFSVAVLRNGESNAAEVLRCCGISMAAFSAVVSKGDSGEA